MRSDRRSAARLAATPPPQRRRGVVDFLRRRWPRLSQDDRVQYEVEVFMCKREGKGRVLRHNGERDKEGVLLSPLDSASPVLGLTRDGKSGEFEGRALRATGRPAGRPAGPSCAAATKTHCLLPSNHGNDLTLLHLSLIAHGIACGLCHYHVNVLRRYLGYLN